LILIERGRVYAAICTLVFWPVMLEIVRPGPVTPKFTVCRASRASDIGWRAPAVYARVIRRAKGVP
jgi:hypothetical protein